EYINKEWRDSIQTVSLQQQKTENRKYTEVIEDNQEILNLVSQGMEVVTALKRYENDSEDKTRRLESLNNLRSKGEFASELSQQEREATVQAAQRATVELLQLQLLVFSGNPRNWRAFWKSFKSFGDT
ncbi:hypothetical protein LOAG_12013, partial [Loa loa]